MVNVGLMRKWIEALESGEYEQTIGCLRDRKGFCCLGVLCDLPAVPGHWEDRGYRASDQWSSLGLSPDIRELIGIDPAAHENLTQLNDSGRTFKEIAQYLRTKHLPE
jgi:hypothetical protein